MLASRVFRSVITAVRRAVSGSAGLTEREMVVARVTDKLLPRYTKIGAERIEQVVGDEFDRLAESRIRFYVPNLVEHAARARLRLEGVRSTPRRSRSRLSP